MLSSVESGKFFSSFQILFKLKLCLAFQLAYSYIQCTDVNWPASSYDTDAGNQDQHPAHR
ncbi:hypothetical protein MTR67_027861 [Solanum verrucosum]|uniref:Uncharacterized protein n=1 Tax=Solanum verrucosum TaxID=315347 RepID=A0AAF0TVU0_SOLVR|nr:hypothetical protein MTR67_027861 [Solanum verrucosum]